MVREFGGRLQRIVAATALTILGLLAFSVPALGAGDPPPFPKPDPPPKATPPPAPHVSGPPAAQPAAPVVVAPAAPAVVHPTAAERRAAEARRAQRKAARVARARRSAAKKLAAAHRRERAQPSIVTAGGTPSSGSAIPFLLVTFSAVLLILGLALTPAWAVPWGRASRALEARREELGIIGATGLVATLVFFLLVQVAK